MTSDPNPVGLRSRPRPTRDQRKALLEALAEYQQPAIALEVVRPSLPQGFEPQAVTCSLKSLHPDRFVLHVNVHPSAGRDQGYALKVYSDDFGEQIWALMRNVAERYRSSGDGFCLPACYLPLRRTLVSPWVEGVRLSDVVDARKPELLRRAARLAAELHRLPLADVPPLTAAMLVAETLDRCGRLRYRWPTMAATMEPLLSLVMEAAQGLHPVAPTVVHGDLAAGQFLWTGERLVLLDLDAARRADPAYDVGHFLGQLERRCTLDANLPAHAGEWLSCFRETYRAAMPGVRWRNVSFYQGLTLVRKIDTLCRRDPLGGPRLAIRLAERARAALESVLPVGCDR